MRRRGGGEEEEGGRGGTVFFLVAFRRPPTQFRRPPTPTPLAPDLPAGPATAHTAVATALAHVKAVLFYAVTFALALPLFATMCALAPAVALVDPLRRRAQHAVNNAWAKVSTRIFYRVTVVGRDNLPPPDAPAVYVANHQSFLDIYTLFWLDAPFKFISKTSNFLIPVIGWSMFLTGHVRLNRVDRRSQLKCLSDCASLLAAGAPVLFFPEGTRSRDGALGDFKKGAFSVAAKARVPVVPVSLVGTGALMPNGREGCLFPGDVTVVVHPPLPPSRDADALMEAARAAIAGPLPPKYRP